MLLKEWLCNESVCNLQFWDGINKIYITDVTNKRKSSAGYPNPAIKFDSNIHKSQYLLHLYSEFFKNVHNVIITGTLRICAYLIFKISHTV